MIDGTVIGIIIEYFIIFLVMIIFNYFIFVRKKKKLDKKRIPVELAYLLVLYKLDIKKINYRKFLWTYSIINSFIVATIYIIVLYLVEGFIWQLIIGAVLLFLLIIICYGLLGRYYQKKEGKSDV